MPDLEACKVMLYAIAQSDYDHTQNSCHYGNVDNICMLARELYSSAKVE